MNALEDSHFSAGRQKKIGFRANFTFPLIGIPGDQKVPVHFDPGPVESQGAASDHLILDSLIFPKQSWPQGPLDHGRQNVDIPCGGVANASSDVSTAGHGEMLLRRVLHLHRKHVFPEESPIGTEIEHPNRGVGMHMAE